MGYFYTTAVSGCLLLAWQHEVTSNSVAALVAWQREDGVNVCPVEVETCGES